MRGVSNLSETQQSYRTIRWSAHAETRKILFFQFNDLALGFFGIRDLTEDQGRPDLYLAMGAMTLAIN